MSTYDNCIIIYWNQGKVKKTVLLSKNTNTPLTQTALGTKTYRAYSATIEALQACTPNSRREHVVQCPNHQETPTDSDEYIADENLLMGSRIKEKGLEEVSEDDKTVKVNNTVTGKPTEGSNMSKLERAGLLTFDPCPKMTHDKQHVHVLSDKQAELMHWHYL